MVKTILLLLSAVVIAGLAYIRLAPMEPERWHADPEAGARTGKPNDYLVAEGGDRGAVFVDAPAADLAARFDAVAMGESRTTRLAGAPEDGWVTYVQRSALMGYPDAISVKVTPQGDGARLTVWSRSRFGRSDFGVNAARVSRWLGALGID